MSTAQANDVSAIINSLTKENIKVKPEWAAECVQHLRNIKSTKLIEDAFQQFLFADLNIVGEGCLPDNVVKMHDKVLQGKYVVQIDEIINIGEPMDYRYKDNASRVLKFSLTDGKQRLFGLEYKPIKQLKIDSIGVKIVIWDVLVRRGMLLLQDSNVRILGGSVKRLITETAQARQNAIRSLIPAEWMRIGEGGEEDVRDLEKELEEKRLAEEAQEDGASQAPIDITSINNSNSNVRAISSPMTSPMTSPVNTLRKSNQYSTSSSPIIATDSFNDHNNTVNNNTNRFNQSLSPPLGRQSIASNLTVSPLSAGQPQMSPGSVNQSLRVSAELQRRMSGSSYGSLYGEIDHGAGSAPYLDEPMDLGELDEETINAIEQIEQQALLQSPQGQVNSPGNVVKGVIIKEEQFDSIDEDMVQEVTTTRVEIKTEDPEDIDQLPTQPMKGHVAENAAMHDFEEYYADDGFNILGGLDETDVTMTNDPCFTYLAELQAQEKTLDKPIRVKVAVMELVKNSFQTKEKYFLKVKIDDGTAAMICSLRSDIIETVLGLSNTEFERLKIYNPNEVKDVAKKLEVWLYSLEGLMEIMYYDPNDDPMIISLLEIDVPMIKRFYNKNFVNSQNPRDETKK